MTEIKITTEVAEADFQRFADKIRLDMEKPRNENERRSIDMARETFIYAVTKGFITVDEEGYATVITECEDLPAVRFGGKAKAIHRRAIDKVKDTSKVSQQQAHIAAILEIPTAKLIQLDEHDTQYVELVYELFLG